MTTSLTAREALFALANPEEREEYSGLLHLQATGKPVDKYGDAADVVMPFEEALLPRLLDKLRSGEWVADGFGYESGRPTQIDPRLWHVLRLNVGANSAAGWAHTAAGFQNTTGTFNALAFTVSKSQQREGGHATRAKKIAELKSFFEQQDKILPASDGKKQFAEAAERAFGEIKGAHFRAAWKDADLPPSRRAPGVRRKTK